MTLLQERPENLQLRLRMLNIQHEAIKLIPEDFARKYNIIPLEVNNKVLHLAMGNPLDIEVIDSLSMLTKMVIDPEEVNADEIRKAIDFHYKSRGEIETEVAKINLDVSTTSELTLSDETDSPISKTISLIINEAIKNGASDIHFQPQGNGLLVRYRIDGALKDVLSLPLHAAPQLISRIKIMANLNIADRLRPQDGQIVFEGNEHTEKTDIRVCIMPSVHGEAAALRLLDTGKVFMSLSQLGFAPESLSQYQDMLQVPHGLILVSGPTGAGKTTTLYASLSSLDYQQRNIITIEDPVEYDFQHITQIRVNVRSGLTFASGLRSVLRSDPDVILIGEIRDAETAQIAFQSALTGHLVLSSIHANDAVGVITRLLDLGIEPFLIASALIGVISQRMVRKICPNCARKVKVSLVEQMAYARETGEQQSEFLHGTGCELCTSGYHGRTGIFEVLRVNDEIRTMISNRASAPELQSQAIKERMISLMQAGMLKVKEQITTPSEVLRNAYSL
jgi:general secretion pathway protein E